MSTKLKYFVWISLVHYSQMVWFRKKKRNKKISDRNCWVDPTDWRTLRYQINCWKRNPNKKYDRLRFDSSYWAKWSFLFFLSLVFCQICFLLHMDRHTRRNGWARNPSPLNRNPFDVACPWIFLLLPYRFARCRVGGRRSWSYKNIGSNQ